MNFKLKYDKINVRSTIVNLTSSESITPIYVEYAINGQCQRYIENDSNPIVDIIFEP